MLVPGNFPAEYADKLRGRGYEVRVNEGTFFEDRLVKSEAEVGWIAETLRLTEEAMAIAIDAIREAEILGNDLYRALMLVATQAITLFIGTTIIRVLGGGFGPLMFVGIPILAILLWGWRKFRYGGVVVEGTGAKKRPGLGRIARAVVRRRERDKLLEEMVGGEPW